MMRPKILVTGSRGMLGRDVVEAFERDCQVIGLSKEELDITDEARVGAVLSESRPSVVINCAAFTKVDLCEEKRELAFLVNAKGPENLARWCSKLDIKLVHISTDYVFDGTASTPYDEDSPTCPINVYGASKLEGEEAVARFSTDFLIIRTSWLFGRSGPNFIT
ncbi:MAG: NAD(P)-dependent oxidoreductase, partial [Thermodesulfobacteria bacterium]|nr:NAD(P)-dependent oxidoreductase [Thermodesulfobacteriota bacterium]